MRLDRVNEGSFYDVTAKFHDSTWTAITPTTVRYRIDCETTGTEIKGWTSVSPDSSVTITVTAAENKIVESHHRDERRVMTVQADAGTDRQYTDTHKWVVTNLRGVK